MSDRQLHQGTTQEVPPLGPSLAPANLPLPMSSVAFRLTADFVVENTTAAEFLERFDATSEEWRLLSTVLTTPEALHRICRLAIVDDLAGDAGFFEGQFSGAMDDEVLAAVLPYLSSEDQSFWTQLMHEVPAVNPLTEIFCEFKTALRRVVVVDTATGEAIPLRKRRVR